MNPDEKESTCKSPHALCALCVVAFIMTLTCQVLLCNMMTSPNGNIFRVTGPLCGEVTGPGEFPTQRPVTPSFDVFFDLRLNKRLSKQPWGWWFETPSWSLWRHCNELIMLPCNLQSYHYHNHYWHYIKKICLCLCFCAGSYTAIAVSTSAGASSRHLFTSEKLFFFGRIDDPEL